MEADPLATRTAALRETHVSIVFFVGDRVYKLKKPVKMDFLDFTTLSAREQVCHREVELNRRLAPDVYLGVAEVLGTDGRPCDYLVVMRRMPEDRRLTAIVQRNEPADACIRHVAREIAAFHARADRSPEISRSGSLDAVRANWESSFETMVPFVGRMLDAGAAARVEALARRYLEGRAPLFASRIANGKIRDGHGDLLADDIFCLADGPRILDCIEFDDRLRHGDVLADVAFLAMDLERVGAADLADRFLSWYREFAAETYPESLAQHYVAYRAHVRAKVACLRADQGDTASGDQARQLLRMTEDHLSRGRVVLILVGGLPGTGKSTLAAALADRLDCTVLRSDEVRKDLAGIGHTTPAGSAYRQGLYDEGTTAATYRELLDRARSLLELGEPVVLDASWSSREWREQAAAVADATSSDLVELRCDAPTSVTRQRLAHRARTGLDASDATVGIAAQMAGDFDAWPTATTVDTSDRPENSASAGRVAVDAALRRRP
jgi:aminoglycoside phosphotransferase family enzyme/predicted kinase